MRRNRSEWEPKEIKRSKSKSKNKSKKKVIKRKRKTMYTCTQNAQILQNFLFEVMNVHGAKDDVHKQVPCFEIHFIHQPTPMRYNESDTVPEVLYAQLVYRTTNKDVANKYVVGEKYDDLPK